MDASTKIALVTGGSRGLGRDMALRLAEKGNDVIITYQSKKEAAEAVVTEIERTGKKAAALFLDTSDFDSIDHFIDQLKSILNSHWQRDHFDFLINNAGMGATITFEKATPKDFDLFMNVHFKSVYFLIQKSLILINNNGRIVNISSGSTRSIVYGYSIYASMKGAIETLTKYLAKELGSKGITVNVLAPGPIETDFNNAAIRNNPERKAMMGTMAALGRVGQANDIGGIVAFLCSEDAGWITGQRIEASGGLTL
jgi:NAD(P)-dependent dehydrogenase (short-subunit alcohol dehydrogenase family)